MNSMNLRATSRIGATGTRSALVLVLVLGLGSVGCAAPGASWHQWGGPNRNFIVDSPKLADTWPEDGPRKIWSRELGKGYSGIAVADGKLITMHRTADEKSDVIVALDADSGEPLWQHSYEAPTLKDQVLDFGKGPNATPLVVGDRIVTVGFTGMLYCTSLKTGKPLWHHDLVKEHGGKIYKFGYASSPMIYRGNLIVPVGGEKVGVMAFNPADGEPVWKSEPIDISYASPVLINVGGQDQIVVMASEEVVGIQADNGDRLWGHPCVNRYKNNATDPIWNGEDLLWVSTQLDGATRVLKLTQKEGKTNVEQVWFNDKVKIFHWNAICIGDHVYGSIGGQTTFLAAVDLRTGDIKWRERGFHKALCIYADEKLIFLDENGVLAMAKVSPEKAEIISQVQLTEKVSWTVPTLVGTTMYVRDNKNIIALDLG
ncbi:MAG: outer membrane protein assembly factor BamB family protein [Planctomycetota bacterium]